MNDDLVAWLRAQVVAEEAAAKDYERAPHTVDCGVRLGYWAEPNCTCDWPAQVHAEVAAKRRIIDRFEFVDSHGPAVDHVRALDMTTGARAALLDAVKMLASVYAGRPGWRAEWATDEEEPSRG